MSADVQGQCPACGNRSLFLASGGYVTCRIAECPRSTAMADLMCEHMSPHHIVKLGESDYFIQHPMRERLGVDELFRCRLHAALAESAGPPRRPGRYQVIERSDGTFSWWPVTT